MRETLEVSLWKMQDYQRELMTMNESVTKDGSLKKEYTGKTYWSALMTVLVAGKRERLGWALTRPVRERRTSVEWSSKMWRSVIVRDGGCCGYRCV